MTSNIHNMCLLKSIVVLTVCILCANGYVTLNQRSAVSMRRFLAEKIPVVTTPAKQQFNFKELIEKCSENSVYTTAVRAAAQYLHSSETLTQSGVNSVIKIYGLAAMVDDAIETLKIAEEKGVSLNVRHYNAVINVCRKHKRYEDAIIVYERLLSSSPSTSSSPSSSSSTTSSSSSSSSSTPTRVNKYTNSKSLNLIPDIASRSR